MGPPRLRGPTGPATGSNDNEDATPPAPKSAPETPASKSEAPCRPGSRRRPIFRMRSPNFADRREKLRILEAVLFASSQPLDEVKLASFLKAGDDVKSLLEELRSSFAGRGVNLVRVAGKWAFRTAEDLSYLLERNVTEERRLSKAALETLAIVAYHQPCTRAEIEEVRGVSTSAGTLDILLETGWVAPAAAAVPPAARHLRHHRAIPRPLRPRCHPRSARPRRAQGLRPARRQPAARLQRARTHRHRRPLAR